MTEPVIDLSVYCSPSSQAELVGYVEPQWREYIGEPGQLPGGRGVTPYLPAPLFRDPQGEMARDAWGEDGASPGSAPAKVEQDITSRTPGIERAIVLPGQTMMWIPSIPNQRVASVLSRAYNDWLVERWLEPSSLFAGVALLPTQVLDAAVEELNRVSVIPGVVGVTIGVNSQNHRLGHPVYHSIYAAAAEQGMPVFIHVGVDAAPDVLTWSAGGGLPLTYAEHAILQTSSLMSHVVSLITQGVFEMLPKLHVILIGGGVSWLPGLLARMDHEYRGLRREVPWLRHEPSEYCPSHVWLGTNPIDSAPSPDKLATLLSGYAWLKDAICFASGYPLRDMDASSDVVGSLPGDWVPGVLYENARSALGGRA